MLVLHIWYYVSGYICIQVTGINLEKFINLCVSRGIYLWNLKRKGKNITVCMGAGNFYFLRPIVRSTGCQVKILKKRGLPFYRRRLRGRWILIAGAILFCLALYVLSSFIWAVEVVGVVDPLQIKEVLLKAEEQGARPGVYKSTIDPDELARKINLELPHLAWVQVDIQGSLLLIEVVPKEFPSKVGLPCHLVAERDGVVQEITVLMGEPLVAEGEAVARGQILVSGFLGQQPVAAQGIVRAIVWHEAYGQYPRWETERRLTGNTHQVVILRAGEWEFPLSGGGEIPFLDYEREVEIKQVRLWRNLFLPVEAIIITYYEVNETRTALTVAEAEARAKAQALARIKSQLAADARILREEVRRVPLGDVERVQIKVIVEVLADIATQQGFDPEVFAEERSQQVETMD
ncbi:MAG: sporulation protein YqfD [bacterium]